MKKQDMINRIKEAALSEMPDVKSRINLGQIVIDDVSTKKSPFSLRKAFSYTFASLMILLTGFSVYTFGVAPTLTDTTPLESESEIIGFQLVSATTLIDLGDVVDLSLVSSNSNLIEMSYDTAVDPIEAEIDIINRYMKLTETCIGNQNSYIYENIDSDNPSYQYAFEYRGADLLGNLITYKGYYNSNVSNGVTLNNGIIIHNDVEYQFRNSVKEVNQNTFIQYRIETDESNYVEVINFSNKNIQKFNYKVYADGILDNESELVLSKKREKLQAKLTLNQNKNNEMILDITNSSIDDNNQFRINYSFSNQNKNGEIIVDLIEDQTQGNYKYQYKSENNTYTGDRLLAAKDKASEDDFRPGNPNNGSNNPPQTTTEQPTTQGSNNPGSGPNTQGNSQGRSQKKSKESSNTLSYIL